MDPLSNVDQVTNKLLRTWIYIRYDAVEYFWYYRIMDTICISYPDYYNYDGK